MQAVAPFLSCDSDPYPGAGRREDRLHHRRLHDERPLPERADGRHDQPERLRRRRTRSFNYVRNSVKAVVDTYNGSVTLYVVDKKDPIIKAYESAFPKLFDQGSVPQSIQDHFRYPEDLFTVQTNMWGRYHINDPQSFYGQTAGWSMAQDPGHDVRNPQQGTTTQPAGPDRADKEAAGRPLLLDPEAAGRVGQQSFMLFRSFVPFSAGRLEEDAERLHDGRERQLQRRLRPAHRRTRYRATSYRARPSSGSNISSNKFVSAVTTPLNQHGSTVTWGNLVLYPIDESLLYMRPLYVAAHGGTEVPQVQDVVVEFGGHTIDRSSPRCSRRWPSCSRTCRPTCWPTWARPRASRPRRPTRRPRCRAARPPPRPRRRRPPSRRPPPSPGTVPKDQTVAQLLTQANAILAKAKADLAASCTAGTCDVTAYLNAVNLYTAYVSPGHQPGIRRGHHHHDRARVLVAGARPVFGGASRAAGRRSIVPGLRSRTVHPGVISGVRVVHDTDHRWPA